MGLLTQGSTCGCCRVDLCTLLPSRVDNNVVVVPPVEVPHRELCLQQLSRYNVDPLEDDNNYGITMYRQALDILS